MSIQDVIGLASELFLWVGIGGALLCFTILILVRAVQGRQVTSEAVVVEAPTGPLLRWLADDGLLRSRPLAEFEVEHLAGPDDLQVYYRHRSPDAVQLQPIDHAEGVLRLLGLILLGVGVLAIVVSFVTMAVA